VWFARKTDLETDNFAVFESSHFDLPLARNDKVYLILRLLMPIRISSSLFCPLSPVNRSLGYLNFMTCCSVLLPLLLTCFVPIVSLSNSKTLIELQMHAEEQTFSDISEQLSY